MGRRGVYWYGSVLNMIKHYADLKKDGSIQANIYKAAIEASMKEIKETQDGEWKVLAVKKLFFEGHTVEETAYFCNAGDRTISRWTSDFVYRVAKKVGY